MAGIAEIIAGAVKGTADTGVSIWNAYQNYKNAEYQKDLQKKLFRREDNAIQRRVADAEAAGFNKFSVLGEGSGAGSTVSVQAPQISEDVGSKAAAALSTMYQLAIQKALVQKADAEAKTADVAFSLANNSLQSNNMDLDLKKLDFWQGLGYNPYYNWNTGEFTVTSPTNDFRIDYNNSPFGRLNRSSFEESEVNLEMKEFANHYKWLQPLLNVLRELSGTANTINSFRRRR